VPFGLGEERYKLVAGRGFVNAKKLMAEGAAKQTAYHLRSAVQELERTLENIELLPVEAQGKLREMEVLLREMAQVASGIPLEEV
jgi:2,3-bisphosphoglycerate-independent phosphoglycerate mutase